MQHSCIPNKQTTTHRVQQNKLNLKKTAKLGVVRPLVCRETRSNNANTTTNAEPSEKKCESSGN